MHQILTAVSMTAFPCLCTALGAGAVFLARPAPGGVDKGRVLGYNKTIKEGHCRQTVEPPPVQA